MKVLIPVDTNTRYAGNPYIIQLISALSDRDEIEFVGFGSAPFFWRKPRWDVIHFQWPEAVVHWKVPTEAQLEALRLQLLDRKRHAVIVSTVHNYEPRENFGATGTALYELIYSNSDAFVHLGQRSLEAFTASFGEKEWYRRARHVVIEHGDYSHYLDFPPDRKLVRASRTDKSTRLLLVFGAIRTLEEEELARTAFQLANLENTNLVFAGGVSLGELGSETLARWNAEVIPNIKRFHRRIPDEQVAPLVKASRFVFILRAGRLNSGVVPLALTFGRPVIGPDDGVVGEVIRAAGGILYKAGDAASAATALQAAYALDDRAYAAMQKRIRAYVRQHMRWPVIAREHVRLYRELIAARRGRSGLRRFLSFARGPRPGRT